MTAWLYESESGETISLAGDENGYIGDHQAVRADGFSESYVTYLSEQGEAYGYYTAFEEDASSEQRLFYYSRKHGLHDLMDLIPQLNQWAPIQPISGGNSSGYLVAGGTNANNEPIGLFIAPPEFTDED